jgi:hypothetical protein
MANTGIRNRVRVGGSGFTVFTWQSQPIGFARQIGHTSPAPVGPGPVAIHPMDEPYPVQVITPGAAGMGTLTLELYELYGGKVWDRLGAKVGVQANQEQVVQDNGTLQGAVDLVDIFIQVAAIPGEIQVVKYIRPPTLKGRTMLPYTEEYHNCVITNVIDGETIEVGTMEVLKTVTVGYTHMTRGGRRSRAWDLRDRTFSGTNFSDTTLLS